MDLQTLVDKLAAITGPLQPGEGASAEDLQAVRRFLARSLAMQQAEPWQDDGQAPEPALVQQAVERLSPDLVAQLTEIAAAALKDAGAPGAKLTARLFLRAVPGRIEHQPASVPAWAHGMAPGRVLGPFTGVDQRPLWFDIFDVVVLVPVVRLPDTTPFLALSMDAGSVKPGRSYALTAGSAWISSPLIGPGAPAGSYSGLRIKGGTLTLDADSTVAGGVIQIPATATATLAINTDPPAAPPAGGGAGADGSHVEVTLPASATFQFAPGGASVTAVADQAAKIYDTKVALKKAAGAAGYVPLLGEVLVPCTATPATFEAKHVFSDLFKPAGKAPTTGGAWGLPVAVISPGSLGAAAGAGTTIVTTDVGLTATWQGLGGRMVPLGPALLQAAPGQLAVLVLAGDRRARQTLSLWHEAKVGGTQRSSSIDILYLKPIFLSFTAQKGLEALLTIGGTAIAHLDRPLQATGNRIPIQAPNALLLLVHRNAGDSVLLSATIDVANLPCVPLALINALLRATSVNRLLLFGKRNGDVVPSGHLSVGFGLRDLVPILPDPYAANIGATVREGTIGTAVGAVAWPDLDHPKLAMAIQLNSDLAGGARLHTHDTIESNVAKLLEEFYRSAGGSRETWMLLDVSSRADQFGVGVGLQAPPVGMTVRGITLAAQSKNLRLITVPEISWEPVRSIDPPDAIPNPFTFADDGLASRVGMNSVQLVPMAPQPLYEQIIAIAQGGGGGAAFFTLPFGMYAVARVQQPDKPGLPATLVDRNQPSFPAPALRGGLQLSLTASPQFKPWEDAVMPGAAVQTPPPNPPNPPTNVLGDDVSTIFNQDFFAGAGGVQNPRVPLIRIDLSGYGASTFSDWKHDPALVPTPPGESTAIIKTQFEVLVGRTAYEVVQARSILYPWGVPVVRTITLFRDGGGGMYRRDSGWVAAGPGVYLVSGMHFHPGAVDGVFNVRNIADTGQQYKVDLGDPAKNIILAAVTFDADVKIQNVKNGGADPGLVPSKGQFGYIKLNPSTELTPQQLADLFARTGPLGGPVSTVVYVAGSAHRLRAARVDVDVSPPEGGGDPEFAAAVRGSPVLPRDGAWGVARKRNGSGATPEPLSPNFPVPLIRKGRIGDPPPTGPWNLADPADLLRSVPGLDYGYLQGTGTQALFVQRPQVDPGSKSIIPPIPPALADVAALLKATGIFPSDIDVFKLPSGFQLNPTPDGLSFNGTDAKYQIPIAAGTQKTLLDLGFIKVYVDFSDLGKNGGPPVSTTITLELKPGRWSVVITPISFVLDIGGFKQILAVTGMFSSSTANAPGFSGLPKTADPFGPRADPIISYGSALQVLTDLLNQLQGFLKALGLDVQLDAHFAGNTLTVRDSLPIPDIPLGLGSISGITLDLGADLTLPDQVRFVAGISSPAKPFKWIVFPLAGTGCIQVAADNAKQDIVVQGGLGLGATIDIGIAKGSVSIILSAELDIGTTDISIKGTITGQAEVDVLGGLASASLTMSCTLGIDIPLAPHDDHVTVFGDMEVGIHISICWVINIDFDGSWQFSRDLQR